MPPLRQRQGDLPLLARHFLDEFEREYGGARELPAAAVDYLYRYGWPGNARELRSAVRNAAAHSAGPRGPVSVLTLQAVARRGHSHFPSRADGRMHVSFDPACDTWATVVERTREAYFSAVFDAVGNDMAEGERRTGVKRTKLYEERRRLAGQPPPDTHQ